MPVLPSHKLIKTCTQISRLSNKKVLIHLFDVKECPCMCCRYAESGAYFGARPKRCSRVERAIASGGRSDCSAVPGQPDQRCKPNIEHHLKAEDCRTEEINSLCLLSMKNGAVFS